MIGRLPQALEVGGRLLPIRSDFRDILAQFEMLNDPELSDLENKTGIGLVFRVEDGTLKEAWIAS